VLIYNNKTKAFSILPTSAVFIAIGYNPAVDLAIKIGLELRKKAI